MTPLFEYEYAIAEAIAAWRAVHPEIAAVLRAIADAYLVKGAALIAFAAAVVARSGRPILIARDGFLLRFTAAAVTAISLGRVLQLTLPHRDRPIAGLSNWAAESSFVDGSSFPSDHAVFFTAMAAAIFFADRRLGVLALLWTGAVVLLPRVLLNFHYPSDIIAGAAIGAAVAAAFMLTPMPAAISRHAAAAELAAPRIVYPLVFLLAFSAATNFETARAAVSALYRALT